MIARQYIGIIFILLPFFAARAQSAGFSDQFIKPVHLESGKYKGFDKYDIGDVFLYHGTRKHKSEFYAVEKETDKIVFSFQDTTRRATSYTLKFFKAGDSVQPAVVMINVEVDHSIGQYILLISGPRVINAGFLHYAADDFNFSSLGLHAIISQVDDQIILTFDSTEIIDFTNETVIDGSKLMFQITPEEIIRIN